MKILVSTKRHFTLIELLVCIAIISILASMLLPALARVRYKAKLVYCVNNQKQVATGLILYSTDYRERWPTRPQLEIAEAAPGHGGRAYPHCIKNNDAPAFDERPILNPYIYIDELYCPFTQPRELMTSTLSRAYHSYRIYAGWRLDVAPGNGAEKMVSPGDVMSWRGDEFDVIVASFQLGDTNKAYNASSHPDRGGVMSLGSLWYETNGTQYRDPIDMNFARSDGSAVQMTNVIYRDPRLKPVPARAYNQTNTDARWMLLPSVGN